MNYYNYIREYLQKSPSLQCIPVKDKAPIIESWSEIEVTEEAIDYWEENLSYKTNGFGYRAGQHNIGWMDIDTDDSVLIHKIDEVMDLSNICSKRGKKGKTVFFRFDKTPKKSKYNVYLNKGDKKPIVEFNFTSGQCVLPPSIHPETGMPYVWVSQSLLDIDIEDLPLINEDKIEYLETIIRAPSLQEGLKNVPTGITGDGSGKWLTITSECSRLLHQGHSETAIARSLVGIDRRLFPNNQFFLSQKIGKCLIGNNDIENATLWVTEYKFNIMRQDSRLRETLVNSVVVSDITIDHDEWPEPRPIMTKKQMVEFPEDLFPSSIKKYCFDLSEISAIPPEAYMAGLLTSFSACAQGKVTINAKSDFSVTPSIASMIVAPSGSRKDSVFDWSREPLKKLIDRDKKDYKANSLDKEKELTQRLIDIDKKYKKAISENDQIMIDQLKEERNRLQSNLTETTLNKSNFIFESGTQERLYKLMEENQHRGIFICSSEFVQMLGVMNKKGNEALKPFLLKLFNGSRKESFSHQTIGGTNVNCDKCYGTALTSIQNDVLAGQFKMVAGGQNNDGFIQRFFLIPIGGKITKMKLTKEAVDTRLVDNVFTLIYDHDEEIVVTFENDEVANAYIDYDYYINTKASTDISFIRSFRSKYSGQSLKLAWILAQLDAKPGVIVRTITMEYYLKAIKWLEWQSNVLDVTYGNINHNEAIKACDIIISHLRTSRGDFSTSDIRKSTGVGHGEMGTALSILIEYDYVRFENNIYKVNPNL